MAPSTLLMKSLTDFGRFPRVWAATTSRNEGSGTKNLGQLVFWQRQIKTNHPGRKALGSFRRSVIA